TVGGRAPHGHERADPTEGPATRGHVVQRPARPHASRPGISSPPPGPREDRRGRVPRRILARQLLLSCVRALGGHVTCGLRHVEQPIAANVSGADARRAAGAASVRRTLRVPSWDCEGTSARSRPKAGYLRTTRVEQKAANRSDPMNAWEPPEELDEYRIVERIG